MIDLIRRRDATQRTLDTWRGRTFTWESDRIGTCAHLLHAHLVNMGHTPPAVPDFDTAIGALGALKTMGFDGLSGLLDDLLEPIPPSRMLLGDVALAPGVGFDAVLICAGPLKVFGWHETRDDVVVMDVALDTLIGAWRT